MSEHAPTERQVLESRKRALDFNRIATGHHEHDIKHMSATGNGTKDPGPFQQRNAPAAELEGTIAESMGETMDDNLAAATPNTKLKNKSQRQTEGGPRSTKK